MDTADTGEATPADDGAPQEGLDLPSASGPRSERTGPILRIWGTSDHWHLWLACVVSALGDWVGLFAITALAAQLWDNPEAATALVLTARVAPGLFLAPLAGVVVDRFDRKKVMLVSDIVRFGVFCTLPFVRSVLGLILASLILEIFTMLWAPAKEALVPQLVPRDKLTTANSLALIAAYCTMPIAGFLQYLLGEGNSALARISWLHVFRFDAGGTTQALPFYFDALTFLTTGIVVWFFVHPARAHTRATRSDGTRLPPPSFAQTLRDVREGWRYIVANPVVRGVNIGLATGLFGGAMLVPLGPTFASKVIGDSGTFSLFITALGLGVATGIGVLSFAQKVLPKRATFLAANFGAGIALVAAASMSSFWPAATFVFVLGLCAGTVYIIGFTLLHMNTDDDLRGRIFSTLLTLVRMCVLFSLLFGPVLATLLDGLAVELVGADSDKIPRLDIAGFSVAIPGVRTSLWVGGLIVMLAAVMATRSMGFGIRESARLVRDKVRRNGSDGTPDDPLLAGGVAEKGSDNPQAGPES